MLQMNPEVRTRWTARLRSGEYAQGTGLLNSLEEGEVRKYCCLGVLCEMAEEAGIVVGQAHPDLTSCVTYVSTQDEDDYSTSSLPVAVQRWAGLGSDDPELANKCGLYLGTCSDLNDGEMPFDQIADLIDGGEAHADDEPGNQG